MRTDKWLSPLWAAILAFLAAFGGVGCIVTGFGISVPEMGWITGTCVVSAVVFTLCFRHKVGWAPLCLLALLFGYLWRKGPLEQSVEALLYHITTLYDCGYGWGVVWWTELDPELADMTLALCAVGIPVTAAVAGTVVRRLSGWLAVTATALPLASCMVLTDSVPQERYLYLVLLVLVMLLLTQTVRRKSERNGNILTAMVILPVALSLVILFGLIPREGYDGQSGAQKIEDFVVQLLNLEEEAPSTGITAVGDMTYERVGLDKVGHRSNQASKVMEVYSDVTGTLYLRGCAYDIYDGHSWSVSEGDWAYDGDYQVSGQAWSVTVSTRNPHDVLYMPGVSSEMLKEMKGGRIDNRKDRSRYTVQCTALPRYATNWNYFGSGVNTNTARQYLTLPEETKSEARNVVLDVLGIPPVNGSAGEIWAYAQRVAEMVKASASYDLKPQTMPRDETDFALWFLQKSDKGYCVHFATTTAVLLRSVGIPTRYVTGYLVNVKDPLGTMVRLRDAHAWVEVFLEGVGWVVLEATPAAAGSPVPLPVPETTPGTAPATTEQTAETTEPTVVTQATEQTAEVTEATTEATEQETLPAVTLPPQTGTVGGADGPSDVQVQGGGKLLWLLPVMAVLLMTLGQWQLRLWLRRKKQHTGTANEQALARWQEAELLGKLGLQPPEELHSLAQKAKFSQHTLTRQELRQFEVHLVHARKALRRAPLWKRLYCTLILAIY